MFIDFWEDPKGLMQFFSDPRVGEQGNKLFTSKEPTVWMPALASCWTSCAAPPMRALA
jgi:hypothetical protein